MKISNESTAMKTKDFNLMQMSWYWLQEIIDTEFQLA